MEIKLLWFQVTLDNQDSFEKFLNLFKTNSRQVKERNGFNAIYFPIKSVPNDYSKVFISINEEEQNLYKEWLSLYRATQIEENLSTKVNKNTPVLSDKNMLYTEDEEAHFM
ncbi:MAG: hypothetical protein WCE54_04695 [Ignavibacteriaceae bacterium]